MPSRYQTVEVTDLMTRIKTYKIFERGRLMDRQPVAAGIPTREQALTLLRALEAIAEQKQQ